MATKPQETVRNINGASIGVMLNSIMQRDTTGYFAGAPAITNTTASLRQVGDYIFAFQNRRNTMYDAIMNKIAFAVFRTLAFYNQWNRFTEKGVLDYGETVEEIYIGLCKAEQYEWTDDIQETLKKLYGKRYATVASAFHSINWTKMYPLTESYAKLKDAFRSFDALENFIRELVESMYKSYEYDNWLVTKYMLYRGALDGQIYNMQVKALDKTTVKDIVTEMKAMMYDAEMVRSSYNAAKVPQTYRPGRILLATTPRFAAFDDVFVAADAFNLTKVQIAERRLPIDGFTKEELDRLDGLFEHDATYEPFTQAELEKISTIYAMVLDEDYFMNYTALIGV